MDNGACSYRRFLDGSEEGLAEIIKEYKDGLMLYLCGFTKNIHTAEDLTEDTFVKIAVKKPKYQGKCSFKTWLYSIGGNVARDYLRKNKNKTTAPLQELEAVLSDEDEIERTYIKDEEKLAVHRAMKELCDDYRRVLYLVYFEGFNCFEASVCMCKSKKQTENMLYQAKRQLKAKLEKEGFYL